MFRDARYAVRNLLTRPGFTAIAAITLMLGIGANTAIFSAINAVLLRPLPFKNPERMVSIWERRANSGAANLPISGHEFVAWKERCTSFDSLTLIQPDGFNLTGRGDPAAVTGARVSADFFSVFGVRPLLGRTFAAGEDQGETKVVILGQKLWMERFGADANVINQTVMLSDQAYTVIGVMPTLELMTDVLVPIEVPREAQKVGKHSHEVIGRLKSGITLDQAQRDVANVAKQLEQEYPNDNTGHGVQLVALHEDIVGNVRLALFTLFGAVG